MQARDSLKEKQNKTVTQKCCLALWVFIYWIFKVIFYDTDTIEPYFQVLSECAFEVHFSSLLSSRRPSRLNLLGQWTQNTQGCKWDWTANPIWWVSSSVHFHVGCGGSVQQTYCRGARISAALFLRNHYKIGVKNIPFIPTCRNGSFSSSWYTIITVMELIWFLRHNLSWLCIVPSNFFFFEDV